MLQNVPCYYIVDVFSEMLSQLVDTIWTEGAHLGARAARRGALGLGEGRKTPFSMYVCIPNLPPLSLL